MEIIWQKNGDIVYRIQMIKKKLATYLKYGFGAISILNSTIN